MTKKIELNKEIRFTATLNQRAVTLSGVPTQEFKGVFGRTNYQLENIKVLYPAKFSEKTLLEGLKQVKQK